MLGELILIRHGKAEKKDSGKRDFDRELTEAGAKEFSDFMRTLVPLLKNKSHLQVWTSPFIRAKETAKILTDTLDCPQAKEKDFIAKGNLDELMKQLQAKDDPFTVICVGHEPTMSTWTKELTGTAIPFAKGAAVCILFDNPESAVGKVDWKLAPQTN